MNAPLPAASRPRSTPLERPVGEQPLPDERSEGQPAERADHTEPDDDDEQAAHPGAELVVASGARERGQLRQQRGLHGLEQEDRDARDEDAGDEAGERVLLGGGLGEDRRGEERRVRQALREERADQQQAERARQLRCTARSGPA